MLTLFLKLEEGWDYFYVNDDDAGTSVAYTGFNLPETAISTGSSITLQFVSDEVYNDRGFLLTYSQMGEWSHNMIFLHHQAILLFLVPVEVITPEATTPEPVPAPADWTPVLDGSLHIKVFPDSARSYDAAQTCMNEGGRLFEPRSQEEYQAVAQHVLDNHWIWDIWIGVTDIYEEGE